MNNILTQSLHNIPFYHFYLKMIIYLHRNREELVKVIAQLKSGEEITPSSTCTENEASSEPENTLEKVWILHNVD